MDTPRDHAPEAAAPPPPLSPLPPPSRRAAAALPWWGRITVRLEVLTASVVVLAMLLLSGLMTYQISSSARQAIVTASGDSAQRLSMLITERVQRIVNPADAIARLLAHDPVTTATTLPERLRRLPVLADLLEQHLLLSALYVGYPDGQFLLLRSLRHTAFRQRADVPDSAAFLLQSVAREQGADAPLVGRWNFYDAQLTLISSALRPDYQFDPRKRPWYQEVQQSRAQTLTAPYLFFTTQELGITLSQPSKEGEAVLGLDVALTDLGREIGELRPVPRTEIAVLDKDNRVLAYPDMSRVLQLDGEQLRMRPLSELGVPSLLAVHQLGVQPGKSLRFEVDGKEWLGQVQPLQSSRWRDWQLVMAIPTAELLSDLNRNLRRQLWLLLAMVGVLLPVGWMAGRRVGRSLSGIATRAQALARFDFSRPPPSASPVREVRELGQVMESMSDTIQEFLRISRHISAESRLDVMLSSVLYELVQASICSGGAVYLVKAANPDDVEHSNLERLARYCVDPFDQPLYPEHLGMAHFLNYTERQLDEDCEGDGCSDQPVLRVQLHTRDGKPLGLLVLRYVEDQRQDESYFRAFVEKLSGTLAVAIETRSLIEGQRKLFDAVIQVLAYTIDAKSPYTGAHCERVPQLAEALMQSLCNTREAPFAQVEMTEAELYEFRLGAWLHDCGKVTSPDHIIDKATKLETLYNRIHEVRMRFEVLWRDAQLAALQQTLAGADQAHIQQALARQQAQLQDDFAFVAQCNIGGEAMADADVQRLESIGQAQWLRYFDDRLGLSRTEEERLDGVPPAALPARERLLANRPEHIVPWGAQRPPVEPDNPANLWKFDMTLPAQAVHLGELHNLAVRRGTLTDEDRFKINDHIVQTVIMLSGLPFPPHLARVPAIASSHHEKLDGTGYPRRLKGAQLSLVDRVMTLADIFEALTASDRPYKPPKTLSQALSIMAGMVREQHIDAEVFRFFLRSSVWSDYAQRFLTQAQRDEVDIAALERLIGAAPTALPQPWEADLQPLA
ncbi:MAG: HD domain-containing protein [Giesbergeria sp.]|nr:HD domain-containing protein [Giesbergeria sp.]